MTRHEQLVENFEDAYFALLMEEVAQKEGERLEQLNQELLDDPAAMIPEELDRRCLKTIDRHFAGQRRKGALRTTRKILNYVAVVMATTMLLLITALAVSEDARIMTANLLITVNERYTEFRRTSETADSEKTPGSADGAYLDIINIGWLPEGFVQTHGDHKVWAGFQSDDGFWINISCTSGDGVLQVDTEDADSVDDIEINGNSGLCVVKDGRTQITLLNEEHNCYIEVATSKGISTETTKKIVENITFN